MYKSKVWIHKNKEELSENNGRFWINHTFLNKPKKGDVLKITNEMIEDIADEELWKREYGLGNYIIEDSSNIFNPDINDGFSFSVMALKVI